MSQIREIKEAVDIIEIIGERVNLKKTGANYRGVCPFHSEKTPSFFVSEEMQRYKCFGCGESGDVYNFLERYEGMTFYEALQHLADRVGVTLETTSVRTQEDDEREQILQALELASKYYHWLLVEHKVGKDALSYLKKRKINKASIKLFQLGFSQDSWDGLIKYLHGKKKLPLKILVKAGLVIAGKYDRHYDRFRGRIVFPLRDHRGRIVGFSGRILTDKKEAKYINSPETMVYHKRKMLYGYSELRAEIRKKNKVIVVEGEIDVIASQQASVNNIVAIKGSALTEEHGVLLKRVAETVLLALDADEAGVVATRRAISTLKKLDLELRVLPLVGGKDPADIVAHSSLEWRKTVKSSISAYEFLIQAALKKHNAQSARGKKLILKELAGPLWSINSKVEREFYLKKLVDLLDVNLETIKFDLKQFAKEKSSRTVRDQSSTIKKPARELNRLEQLERWLVVLLSSASEQKKLTKLYDDLMEIGQSIGVSPWLSRLLQFLTKQKQMQLGSATRSLPDDMQQTVFEALADEKLLRLADKVDIDKEWQELKKKLLAELRRQARLKIQNQLETLGRKQAKTEADTEKENELLVQLARLT